MRTLRELLQINYRSQTALGMPVWFSEAESLPNRNFINDTEKELVDLLRKYGEFSKADLVTSTDYSRTKITNCIESLLNKKIIIANTVTEYTGGRRSKIFKLNRSLGLLAGVDIGATSVDLAISVYQGT